MPGPTARLPAVHGSEVDRHTRCRHYDGARDVVAIRFACCARYYACHRCHDERAGHAPARWPAHRFHARAVLCGVCRRELTVAEYLGCEHRCPGCGTPFNPRCARHHRLYFELAPQS